jgi:hypothetical protein
MFSIFHRLILVDLLFLLAHFVSALQWHEPFLLALLSFVQSIGDKLETLSKKSEDENKMIKQEIMSKESEITQLKAAYKCTENLYEGKQPSWYGSVQHILQNMPRLTNFLTDKTSTFKNKCNKIVKQHYLKLWTKQAA